MRVKDNSWTRCERIRERLAFGTASRPRLRQERSEEGNRESGAGPVETKERVLSDPSVAQVQGNIATSPFEGLKLEGIRLISEIRRNSEGVLSAS